MDVLNDILDFAKLEGHHLTIESVPFSLRDCIGQSTDMLLAPARNKGLSLLCDISSDVPAQVRGDPTRLRQILLNLIGNAIKFTSAGYIRVLVQPAGSAIQFTVEDTGIGIAPEQQSHIFHPFRQGDISTTRKFGGTGLGLAITAELVELMDGDIHLDSAPGKGSRFHVKTPLPRASIVASIVEESPVQPLPPSLDLTG